MADDFDKVRAIDAVMELVNLGLRELKQPPQVRDELFDGTVAVFIRFSAARFLVLQLTKHLTESPAVL